MTLFDAKFFQIIQTFSSAELKSFELWLKSPWANSNKNLIRLLEKVQKHHPHFDYPKLTKTKLFQQILPNGKYSDRRMNNLLSEGFLAAEKFLIFNNLAHNQNLKKDLLTQEYQNRHLEDWFFRDINKEVERLEEKEIKDWEDHLDLLRLNRRIYHHPNQNPRMQPGGQTIVKMGEQLDLVYLLEKAVIINEKIFRNRILKNENHEVETELAVWLAASEGVEHLAVELYRMRFGYREETMLEQYFELRKIFIERHSELNKKEQKIHLFSLLNDNSNLGKKNTLINTGDALPLYKVGLGTKTLFTSNQITFKTYASIVIASNLKKDFFFTKHFLNLHTGNLKKQIQGEALSWAKAHTAYREGKLEECLDILLSANFKENFFLILTKILTLQTYFDLFLKDDSYHFFLFNYFDSFEKWLNREDNYAKINKNSLLKFVQKSRVLAKYFLKRPFPLENVKNLIKNESNIQAAIWLKQKIEDIITLKT